MASLVLVLALVVVSSLLAAFGSLFMKRGAKHLDRNVQKQLKNYPLLLGIFLFGSSAVVYIAALRLANLSLLYPLSSLTYIWAMILSAVFLKEKITMYKISGIALIILGIIVLTQF